MRAGSVLPMWKTLFDVMDRSSVGRNSKGEKVRARAGRVCLAVCHPSTAALALPYKPRPTEPDCDVSSQPSLNSDFDLPYYVRM